MFLIHNWMRDINWWKTQFEEVRFVWTHRDANQAADLLAKQSLPGNNRKGTLYRASDDLSTYRIAYIFPNLASHLRILVKIVCPMITILKGQYAESLGCHVTKNNQPIRTFRLDMSNRLKSFLDFTFSFNLEWAGLRLHRL
ncbi:hypothetical protein HID58_017754 [Brassica napus]|uniref:RNase H type-1 domain-containing protein n=1 Tax=Brassica napus TaxID=3708 RepID=A0ABQ8D801_BRANA|nr:hypothetical protein HID58_017754 [Brassica napus]